MSELPRAHVARLLKSTGATRVSGDAVDLMNEAMEDYGISLASKAVTYARHAGRKTIKADDVKLALK
jgi:histone H3/H4